MKILVDATLAFKSDWYDLIPVNISLDDIELEDSNEENNKEIIIKSKKKKTSYLSPEKVKKRFSEKTKTIIFTIPSSLSGQYLAYKNFESENVLILEGTAFTTRKNEIKKIIEKYNDLKKIEKEIKILNSKIKYDGFILKPSSIPKKGRIFNLMTNIINTLKIKIWIKFSDSKWKKEKIIRNVIKNIKKIIDDKDTVNIIHSDKSKISIKYIKEIKNYNKNVNIHIMTNSMIAHAGLDLLVIY
ncbi:MAG: DegV family protein [Mycoplasmatales bacterium]|nr:DegV family protein [Mycoplasmatales bacterium]